jgi:hypothetical protein
MNGRTRAAKKFAARRQAPNKGLFICHPQKTPQKCKHFWGPRQGEKQGQEFFALFDLIVLFSRLV